MNKISLKLLLKLLFIGGVAILCVFLGSCQGPEEKVLFPDNWPVEENDNGVFTLVSGNSEMTVSIRGTLPYITSLKTIGGKEKISIPAYVSLPESCESKKGYADFDWYYDSYKRYSDGKGGLGFILSFSDKYHGASYDMYLVTYPDSAAPFELYGYLKNNQKHKISVELEEIFYAQLGGDNIPTAWKFSKESGAAEGWALYNGTFFNGTGIYKKEMTEGTLFTAYANAFQDWNQSGDIPMVYLDYGTDGVYYALEWSNGALKTKGIYDNNVSIAVNLSQYSMKTYVDKNSSLFIPPVYLGVYDGDVDEGSNLFKKWFFLHKAPDCMRENENEPLTQQDMQIGLEASQYGIQSIKWDYGWWDNAPTLQSVHEGLLRVENKNYLNVMEGYDCDTLKQFTDKAKENDLSLALYVLLKDTFLDEKDVPTSIGAHGHREWFSDRKITGGASADLGNEECVEFYKKYMAEFFTENGITTWRSDIEPIAATSDKDNRHRSGGNDVQYWCTVGFRDLVDYLYDNVPNFRYESCSSGGSMKDPFTMTKATVINCDDSADYMSLHMSFYDSSYCIHPAQLQLPCNALTYTPGSDNYTGTADYLYGLRCVLTGSVMLSNWNGTTEEDKSYWPYYIAEVYNTKMKPLIREGDLYHILPRPDGIHWDGLQYADADSENEIKGLVMLWKPTDEEGSSKNVKLRGLNPDTVYSLTFEDRPEQNTVLSGSVLMTEGLTVTISEEVGSEMIWIREN